MYYIIPRDRKSNLHGEARGRRVLGPVVVCGVDADARLEDEHGLVRRLRKLQDVGLAVHVVHVAQAQAHDAAFAVFALINK